jgi:hypothetical protein
MLRWQVKEGKKPKFKLGVADAKLGAAVQDETSIPCVCNEFTGEVGGMAPSSSLSPVACWTGAKAPTWCFRRSRVRTPVGTSAVTPQRIIQQQWNG